MFWCKIQTELKFIRLNNWLPFIVILLKLLHFFYYVTIIDIANWHQWCHYYIVSIHNVILHGFKFALFHSLYKLTRWHHHQLIYIWVLNQILYFEEILSSWQIIIGVGFLFFTNRITFILLILSCLCLLRSRIKQEKM